MPVELDAAVLDHLYPAHLIVDHHGVILSAGPSIRRQDAAILPGTRLTDHFRSNGAGGVVELDSFARQRDMLQLRSHAGAMVLSGAVVAIADGYLLAMANTPAALSIDHSGLQMSDFGPADPIVPALMLVGLQQAMLDESRAIAEELTQERLKSVNLLDRISRVSGYMAHDFNNLLSIISLNATRLAKSRDLAAPHQRLAGIIAQTAERGSEISRGLMSLSAQRHDSRLPLAVDALINANAAFLSTIAGSRIRLRYDLQADAAIAEVSRNGLMSSLLNVVINARDAMQGGGEITITTRIVARETDSATGSPVDHIAIYVSDTGTGMDEAVLRRAFEPFFSTKDSNSGMGLAAVMDFLRDMGGHATIDSKPGDGTTVHLYLPVCERADDSATQSAGAVPQGRHAATRVLVVEDEPYALEALSEMLEDDGHIVSAAPSAVIAKDLLMQEQPDIILSDVIMPDVSGLELARWASRHCPQTAIILMSGYVPDKDEMQPDWLFIRKPIETDLLRELVQEALARRNRLQS